MHLYRVNISPVDTLDRMRHLLLVLIGTVLGSMDCEAARVTKELKKPVRRRNCCIVNSRARLSYPVSSGPMSVSVPPRDGSKLHLLSG
jgi:hypothetical protein